MTIDLSPVREILRLDGGDVELISLEPSKVHLRLLLETSECADCVLPKTMLEQVALKLLAPGMPGLTAVVIDDPREH